MTTNGITVNVNRISLMIAGLALACFACGGCSHLTVTNTTKDGRVFEASARSLLWDRNLGGLQFDYEKGTLDIADYKSTPDKETIAKGLDMITSAIELMKSAAK